MVFLSQYPKTLDRKNRVSTPNAFRTVLSNESFFGIVAVQSYSLPTIDCFGMSRMEKMSAECDFEYPFSSELPPMTSIFADSHMLQFDADGRIILSESLLKHAHIEKELVFVGRGPIFQIWNPNLFKEHQDEARKKLIASKNNN